MIGRDLTIADIASISIQNSWLNINVNKDKYS